ncbi:serine/threonine-protein kinase [Gemmatimonas groenlandica]|uniref:Protein kinase n=1 Tax=Gemmatimonas groenlandica TaxID=2732249 RepID=A0A6M4IVZ6_9BACT|nr:serine/threonine-protein kinase [Gemmatimonas groenlandica]QJR37042.1 protein kinase [Gemmatimonas groenlandica]
MTDTPSADLQSRLTRALAGQYRIDRLLGQGGMGSVYLAQDETLDRPVAIKVVLPDVAGSADVRQRFVQESRTVARLRHPNIVAVYAAGEADGLLYFVMEYVPGESLRDRLTREQTLPTNDAVAILRDLGLALDYAHTAGVVHRDVKPENVLLDGESGRAMLTDFGVARAIAATDLRLTGAGFSLGSPRYMSPEQASGDGTLDGRSDLYSLGLIGYEIFSGQPAVTATTAASILVKHLTEQVPSLATLPSVPDDVANAVDQLLQKDPDARHQRGAAFAAALSGEVFDGNTPTSQIGRASGGTARAKKGMSSRNKAMALGGAALAIAASVFVVMSGGRSTNDKEWLVAPFEVQGPDRSLDWLREGSLNMLTLSLAQWEDLHVVEYERTLDLLRDAKLEDARRVGLDQARDIARHAGAGRVVMGQLTAIGDSLIVTASLYDVKSGNSTDKARVAAVKGSDPRTVFETVAGELLNLVGAPRLTFDLAKQTTTSVQAYRVYLEGLRHLNGWRLRAADSAFRRAIAADSTFALAHYRQSLALGWEASADTMRRVSAEASVRFASRLPLRQQELVKGNAELTRGFMAQETGDTATVRSSFLASRARLARLVASDSLDAEAWYALADADYHLVWGTSYGRSPDSTARYLNESLQGFRRTIALDSTFHLAYSHLVEMYNQSSSAGSFLVLVGDSIKAGGPESYERRIGTVEQVRALRAAASLRAREAAYAWISVDPDARAARRVLADNFVRAGYPDSSVRVLNEAMARPSVAHSSFLWTIADINARAFKRGAGPEAKLTLKRFTADSLLQFGLGERIGVIFGALTVGGLTGSPSLLDDVKTVAVKALPSLPGTTSAETRLVLESYALSIRSAMGVPLSGTDQQALLTMAQRMEKAPVMRRDPSLAYAAYLSTHDTQFAKSAMATVTSPGGLPELDGLIALEAGDTTRALRAIRTMPSADSIRRSPLGMNGMRSIGRAMLLAEMGDKRRAAELLETIDVQRMVSGNFVEVGWPWYVRSHVIRGRLYEQLGERQKAVAAFEKFLSLWPDAEAPLQPQLREARESVARLKDAARTP